MRSLRNSAIHKKPSSEATANIWLHHEIKLEAVVREKLRMLFRRFVLCVQNSGGEVREIVRENLVMLFRRFPFRVGCPVQSQRP